MIINILISIILVMILCLSLVLFYMLKYNRNFLKQIQSIRGTVLGMLEVGEYAPLFRSVDEQGNRIVAKNLYREKSTLLIFAHSQCSACKEVVKQLSKIEKNYDINIIVNNRDTLFDDSELKSHIPKNVHYLREEFLASTYLVQSTPTVFLIKDERIAASALVTKPQTLLNMLLDERSKNEVFKSAL